MNLPRERILINSKFPKEMEILIKHADKALKEWEPIWTPFFSPQVIEEAKKKFNNLNDLTCNYEGGFPRAERQRICFVRSAKEQFDNYSNIPIKGIYLKGNFLFDRAKPNDFIKVMEDLGTQPKDIGDIWLIRDRGAQAICSNECSNLMDKKIGTLREVHITCQSLAISEMEIPFKRAEKIINTVEASTRVDAIASAGFGLSRSKISAQIKQGCLRLNWIPNKQASKEIKVGDLIHLEKKGSLQVLTIDKTKKERWRIKLLRQ